MNQPVDWSTYKFHPSGLKHMMVKSRKKDEILSETTKAALREIYIREVWGRERTDVLANKYMQKGIMCETDSIAMVERVTGNKYFKNQKTLENDYIIGTPDIISPNLVDIKTSWDIFTFSAVDEDQARKDYYYQMLGYMWLTGHEKATLTYCLVNTPDTLVNDELYRLSFKFQNGEEEQYRHNYIYDDIPEELRVKEYEFSFSEQDVEEIKSKIVAAREFLAGLSL